MKNNMKYLRISKEFDLTQGELAKELGVSRATINGVENGKSPSAELMLKIAKFFNKDPRDIFFEEHVAQIERKIEEKEVS